MSTQTKKQVTNQNRIGTQRTKKIHQISFQRLQIREEDLTIQRNLQILRAFREVKTHKRAKNPTIKSQIPQKNRRLKSRFSADLMKSAKTLP